MISMKILHTGDIHLRNVDDERWQALEKIIEIGNKNEIDILVIAGDMFDKGVDGEKLRPHIRSLFENSTFTTLILPGNHDYEIFEESLYWGKNVVVIHDFKQPYSEDTSVFWGLPFENLTEEEILERLYEMGKLMDNSKTNILIFHGELTDAFGWLKGFGDEGTKRYMPVKTAYFKDLPISYVLAGHFHTNFEVIKLPNNGYFVYPGSPVSITTKEIGRRKVNLFTVGEPPQEYSIDTFHYEKKKIYIDPLEEIDPLEQIKSEIEPLFSGTDKNYKVMIEISGYINRAKHATSEGDIQQYLDVLKEKYSSQISDITNHVQDLTRILNDPLFLQFSEKLNALDYSEEDKRRITEYVLKAMMEVL
ncbi:metallophosphoesterase [Candidatus Aciduliprofundum boonei]|uniref:Metallophosphoesterase n=1 Tax=Aciduliprofundum boonei (strain DSM 19572 / T469) TaxID=439481 RepID=B5IHB5_ACIB4|nr:metallophosphoesterase [Candidatus Aciduliprofundum boonei]ADD08846.1 metallophosphoesterase [Aciduliprofundum boonei T469]EDY34355.1 Ser/Thr protein phosphatase family protein [Aciduliprofundum boonei T469]HII55600.1 serine/threonine protein phosphatase [Candidatus Aciduliprofundum boonei]